MVKNRSNAEKCSATTAESHLKSAERRVVDLNEAKSGPLEGPQRRGLNPRDEFIAEQVAILVRGIRKNAGLNQSELAERCGLSQGRISQIEKGIAEPSIFAMVRIIEACGSRPRLVAVAPGGEEKNGLGVFLVPHPDTVAGKYKNTPFQ